MHPNRRTQYQALLKWKGLTSALQLQEQPIDDVPEEIHVEQFQQQLAEVRRPARDRLYNAGARRTRNEPAIVSA